MTFQLLAVTDYTQPIEGFADKLSFGGQMVLLGMGSIFSVLCLLWLCLAIFGRVFDKSAKPAVEAEAPVSAPAEAPIASDDDEQIIAAIAAAIAMAEAEGNGAKFRVVSFRRK